MALSGAVRLSAAELVTKTVAAGVPHAWDVVIVDDAQHLAPASGELVAQLLRKARLGVVGGDVNQSVFRFRGASPAFFGNLGGLEHQVIDLGLSRRTPRRNVCITPDQQTQQAVVVDAIRRAHFEEGVAFKDMAVVVRATPMIESHRRALLHAGVPVTLDPTDVVLSEQRIVVSLMLGLKALNHELTVTQWRDLLLGPVGGADPVTLRRLLRGLRRFAPEERAEATLRALLLAREDLPDFGTMLTDREQDILARMRGVLDAGRTAQDNGGSVEEILWAIWSATGLADRLLAAALRGGATGSQADRDLDAAMALFDAAGDFTERRPTAGIDLFVDYITEQELPTGVRDRRTAAPDAVALLTAHGAAGKEFRRVIVAGVQESSWPSLGETGTLFRQEDLIDLVDEGVDPAVPVSHIAERLVEERRLFHLATTRATETLTVTAVDDADGEEAIAPSRFVEEFAEEFEIAPVAAAIADTAAEELGDGADATTVRVLAKEDVLAELRRALTNPDSAEATRTQAARQLARLAEAGVAGADPETWWSVTQPSISNALPLRSTLSPSRIESLLQCPLRAVLERMVQIDETTAMIFGSMAHAYLEALGRGVDQPTARAAVMDARRKAEHGPAWKAARDIEDFAVMLDRIDGWLSVRSATFTPLAVEANVDVAVDDHVRIAGRLDRLERDAAGDVFIVDLKTGNTAPSAAQTQENPQLAAYQLAVSRGTLADGAITTAQDPEDALTVGGALLVYPKAPTVKVTTREQNPKSADELEEFSALLRPLPRAMAGPELTATTGEHCEHCRVRTLCPVQPEGQVVTRD